jgi:hypothetical protein
MTTTLLKIDKDEPVINLENLIQPLWQGSGVMFVNPQDR